jgi:LDH2 family malate/lactate/ureidoglycolate dehydrogenase
MVKGEKIPIGWALDENARPTDDPERAFKARRMIPLGSTRELGSHKGYGLAVAVDILSAVLSGGMYGNLAERHPPQDERDKISSTHFFAALRVDSFRPLAEFKAAVTDLLDALRDSAKAEGQERVYTAGEIEHYTEAERRKTGIPYHPAFIEQLASLAKEFDLASVV